MSEQTPIQVLQAEVDALRVALVTMIVWISGSANSPLSRDEWQRLADMAEQRVRK